MGPLRGDVLLVFVKEPRPGAVKSRLAAAIGPERAAGVYKALAEEEIRRTAPRGDEFERLFSFSPPAAREAVAAWLPGETLVAQSEGDIGARMSRAFEDVFARGARRVALVGTDVPSLTREDVVEAIESLDDQEVVIGPATDGGYYLLALKRPDPVFSRASPGAPRRSSPRPSTAPSASAAPCASCARWETWTPPKTWPRPGRRSRPSSRTA